MYSVSVFSVLRPCTCWLCMVVASGRCVRIRSKLRSVGCELLLGRFCGGLGLWRRVEEVVVAEGTAA